MTEPVTDLPAFTDGEPQSSAADARLNTVMAPTYLNDNALGGYQDLLYGTLDLPCP